MKDARGLLLTGNKDRMLWPDWARAVAMLFILLGHAGAGFSFVSRISLLFYVPVFFVASGCIYRKREESFGKFVRRRAKRLLKPYFGYSLFLFLFYNSKELLMGGWSRQKALTALAGIVYGRYGMNPPGGEGTVVLMTIWNSPLWFLPALFLSELLFELLYRRYGENGRKLTAALCVCLGVGTAAHYLTPALLAWSLECIPLFTVWIGVGYLVFRSGHQIKGIMAAGMLAVTVLCAWLNGPVNISVGRFGNSVLCGMAGTVCASVLLLYACRVLEEWLAAGGKDKKYGRFPVLTAIGQNTMPILGMHLFVFLWIAGAAQVILPAAWQTGAVNTLWRTGMAFVTIAVILGGVYWKRIIVSWLSRIKGY